MAREGRRAWNEFLGRVLIEGASDSQRVVFYTALYRSLLFPRTWHEVDPEGQTLHYSPYDGHVRAGVLYADFGLWDTYRTLFPLLTLLYPERMADVSQRAPERLQGGWPLPEVAEPRLPRGDAGHAGGSGLRRRLGQGRARL